MEAGSDDEHEDPQGRSSEDSPKRASLSSTPPDAELLTTLIGPPSEQIDPASEPIDLSVMSSKMSLYKTLQSSSYSTLMPYQVSQVCDILKTCFPEPVTHIVDATAHIGGDSILFAAIFGSATIISLDNDPKAIECLTSNISSYSDPRRFEVVHTNSVEWIRLQGKMKTTPGADFYYFDPPWGGPKYYSKKEISLSLDSIPIADVVNMVLVLGLTKRVLLKVPRNFAYPSFKSAVRGVCKLFYIKKPQKNGSIAYGLILITDGVIHR